MVVVASAPAPTTSDADELPWLAPAPEPEAVFEDAVAPDAKPAAREAACAAAASGEYGRRTVTIRVNDTSGVAGFVLPGDRVARAEAAVAEPAKPKPKPATRPAAKGLAKARSSSAMSNGTRGTP